VSASSLPLTISLLAFYKLPGVNFNETRIRSKEENGIGFDTHYAKKQEQ
jgi:hypothetical protein